MPSYTPSLRAMSHPRPASHAGRSDDPSPRGRRQPAPDVRGPGRSAGPGWPENTEPLPGDRELTHSRWQEIADDLVRPCPETGENVGPPAYGRTGASASGSAAEGWRRQRWLLAAWGRPPLWSGGRRAARCTKKRGGCKLHARVDDDGSSQPRSTIPLRGPFGGQHPEGVSRGSDNSGRAPHPLSPYPRRRRTSARRVE